MANSISQGIDWGGIAHGSAVDINLHSVKVYIIYSTAASPWGEGVRGG